MCDPRGAERGRARSLIGCRRPLAGVVLAHERPAARPLLAGEDVAQERSALPEVALPSSSDPSWRRRESMSDDAMIAVDPHKAGNTAAVPAR